AGAAMGPTLGAELGVVAEGQQGVLMGRGDEDDVAPVTAVASVGAAPRDVGLAPEADAAPAAVARLDEDLDPVDEHRSPPLGGGRHRGQLAAGTTLTRRPRPPWSSNLTCPSTSANRVWSFARPT